MYSLLFGESNRNGVRKLKFIRPQLLVTELAGCV